MTACPTAGNSSTDSIPPTLMTGTVTPTPTEYTSRPPTALNSTATGPTSMSTGSSQLRRAGSTAPTRATWTPTATGLPTARSTGGGSLSLLTSSVTISTKSTSATSRLASWQNRSTSRAGSVQEQEAAPTGRPTRPMPIPTAMVCQTVGRWSTAGGSVTLTTAVTCGHWILVTQQTRTKMPMATA